METKILTVNPRDLKLLEVNARYMKPDEFRKLVANIKRDGCLTQLPFVCKDKEARKWLVLSGNHRVQAAIEAGLETIQVQATNKNLTKDERIAIQLSHNAISGQDDMAILKDLYGAIDDIEMKSYSGLNDETLKLLDKITADSIGAPSLEYQMLNILFLPSEVKEIKSALKEFKNEIERTPTITAHFQDYKDFMATLNDVGKGRLVKNTALTFMCMLRLAQNNMGQLCETWMTEAKPKDLVPLSSIIGRSDIRAQQGIEVKKAIDLMVSRGVIKNKNREQGLVEMARFYLEHNGKKKGDKKQC